MVEEYGPTLLVDVTVVIACVLLLLKYGNLRFTHPATPYIVFHVHTVTIRLAGLINGGKTLYQNSRFFEEVIPSEIIRAARYCDFAFCTVTAVWIVFALRGEREQKPQPPRLMLDPRLLRPILLVAFVVGIVGLRLVASIPGIGTYEGFNPESDWTTSSYLFILPTWFGLAVLGYIYYYGFGRISTLLVVFYLGLMALQGGMRFRAIIGLLLAIQILVERTNRRWPSRSVVLGLIVAAVMFFPMKQIGGQLQGGEAVADIATSLTDSVSEAAEGTASDQMFLDEFASALTLLDAKDTLYLGSIYIPLLTLPIPRALWPNKPSLAGFVEDISTRSRPMARSGMITTYLGEAYANFGVVGIFVVPIVLAVTLAMFHRRARAAPYHSVLRFVYVLLSVNLLQVYRDGLQSIVIFMFVNMMPLMIIALAHILRSIVVRPAEVAPSAITPNRREVGDAPVGVSS